MNRPLPRATSVVKRFEERRWLTVLVLLVWIGLWEVVARYSGVSPLYLPAPSLVLVTAISLFPDTIWPALVTSFGRWAFGVVCGTGFALLLVFLMSVSRVVRAVFSPVVAFLYPVPKIAILPLLVLWLGIGEAPKLLILTLGVFFPVFWSVMGAVDHVPPIHWEVAGVYRLGLWTTWRYVILPSVASALIAGLRLGTGTALMLLVAAEMIAAEQGLGALILHYGDLVLTAPLLACVLLLSLWGVLVQVILNGVARRLLHWQR